MAYLIELLPSAEENLTHLNNIEKQHIVKRLEWLSVNIQNITPKMFSGRLQGLYKLRAGNYRIIYDINHTEKLITVYFIGHRKDIYKTK